MAECPASRIYLSRIFNCAVSIIRRLSKRTSGPLAAWRGAAVVRTARVKLAQDAYSNEGGAP